MRRKFLAAVALASAPLALMIPGVSSSKATEVQLDLPQPKGCNSIGTKTIVLADAHRNRELVVTMWYPAKEGKSEFAPYMDKKTADAVAEDWKLRAGFERQVHTHSRLLAPVAEGGPFPVVLLEHGSGVVPAIYTVLAEGLASSGFIVVATNHPPDSLISVFPDGHEMRFTPYWPVDADRKTQGEAIGRFAENVLVADVHFVLDKLEEMESHDNFWRGHLDLSRVGIAGHSMGGTTAALATKEEHRILAGVNLDGSTFPGMNADVRPVEVHKPFLFIMTEEHASNPASRGREYVGRESNTYYVVVPGTDHMSFTDAHLISSRFAREPAADSSAQFGRALLTTGLTNSLVTEFFRKYLKNGNAPQLDLAVTVERK
jgi:dienelactone hydrolase